MRIKFIRYFIVTMIFCCALLGYGLAENSSEDWESYSQGLFLKNRALKIYSPNKRMKLLEDAISRFKEAEKSGNALEQVYFQISQCYYFMGKFSKSEEFARKSIGVKKDYFPPYNRLFVLSMRERKHDRAARILKQYSDIKPEDPYPLYRLALLYENNLGKRNDAMAILEKIIKLSQSKIVPPDLMKKVWSLKGLISFKKGDYSVSSYSFKKAYEFNESDMEIVFMLAKISMLQYKLNDAERYSLIFLKSFPNNIAVNLILGRVYYLRGNDDASVRLLRATKGKNFDSITAVALYYELIGKDGKSEQLLKVLSRYKNPPIALSIALARIKERKGKPELAREQFSIAGTLAFRAGLFTIAERLFYKALYLGSKKDKNIHYYLARTHEENKKYAMAISFYSKFYSLSHDKSILTHIGYLYGIKGEYKRANAYFKRAIKLSPKEPLPYFFKGLVEIWNKKYDSALVNLRRAIAIKGDEEPYYFYQAVAYEKLHRVDRAIASLKKALKYNPRSSRANNYLGYLYLEKGIKYGEAYRLIKRALEYEPKNGAYLDSMGWFYFKRGKYEESLSYLLNAAERLELTESIDPVVFDHIGDAYLKLGNRKKAVEYWKKANKLKRDRKILGKIRKYK